MRLVTQNGNSIKLTLVISREALLGLVELLLSLAHLVLFLTCNLLSLLTQVAVVEVAEAVEVEEAVSQTHTLI